MTTMSIMGLYNYDETIFDDMALPDGVGRENFITELLLQLAELEVVYARPDVMKTAIKAWSASRLHEWERILTALTFDYNALYNKEGDTTETISSQATGDSVGSNIHSVSGYNTTGFQNAEKDESSAQTSSAGTQTRTTHEAGNIGVTMSQEMLRAEVKVRSEYDITHIIIDEFKRRFCIMVY